MPVHGACHAIVDVVSLLTRTLYIHVCIHVCQCAHTLLTVYIHVHVLPSRSLSTCIYGGKSVLKKCTSTRTPTDMNGASCSGRCVIASTYMYVYAHTVATVCVHVRLSTLQISQTIHIFGGAWWSR